MRTSPTPIQKGDDGRSLHMSAGVQMCILGASSLQLSTLTANHGLPHASLLLMASESLRLCFSAACLKAVVCASTCDEKAAIPASGSANVQGSAFTRVAQESLKIKLTWQCNHSPLSSDFSVFSPSPKSWAFREELWWETPQIPCKNIPCITSECPAPSLNFFFISTTWLASSSLLATNQWIFIRTSTWAGKQFPTFYVV